MALDLGRTLALTAAAGLAAGLVGCDKPAADASGAATDDGGNAANCCKGKNDCKGKGNCKTDSHDCGGKNDCKGQGGCKPESCK